MKISIREFILYINLIVAIILFFINALSPLACALFALFTLVVVILNSLKVNKNRIVYSTALLMYTIATQFGLVIPYLFFGRDTFSEYSDWTLNFMNSSYLSQAILLGIIAVTSMNIGMLIARKKSSIDDSNIDILKNDVVLGNRMYIASIILLSIVFIFFAINIFRGGMNIVATYRIFRNSTAYNSSIYSYILIIFYVGTLYLAAAGSIKSHKIGWILWLILVLLFALNGNKGEFMYALLAVVGMKGVEGQKLNRKLLVIIGVTLFLVIPAITSLRNVGIIGNIRNARINIFEAFGEMGMQLRMSVYSLEDVANGKYGYLWGESYWRPVFNILTPFIFRHTQATAAIRSLYPGNGYSQVIESYLNFRMFGVVVFHLLVGCIISKYETRVVNRGKLAYLGTIVCILINATRNYFAFVPGHILLVTVIYILICGIKINKSKV